MNGFQKIFDFAGKQSFYFIEAIGSFGRPLLHFLNINFQSKDQNIIAEYSVEGYTYCKGFWSGELEAHPCTWFSGLLVFGESVRANKNGKCTSLVSGTSYLVTDCVENVLLTFCNISCSDILNNLISNCCFS